MEKTHWLQKLFAFLELLRLRILSMVLVSCCIGYSAARKGSFDSGELAITLIGVSLLSGGACTLNCYLERESDALMPRTASRPIPSGVISANSALIFGVAVITVGSILLFEKVNFIAGILGAAAVLIYLLIYTPAKKLTWMNTSIGAIPGAIPPLIGWAAATGGLQLGGWILFAMLFLWQHVHFFPIAWIYRHDYEKAGIRMLPVLESTGKKTFLFTLIAAIALCPVSLSLCRVDQIGASYFIGAASLSILLIAAGFRLSAQPTPAKAKMVLILCLWYLPVLLGAVLLDRYTAEMDGTMHGIAPAKSGNSSTLNKQDLQGQMHNWFFAQESLRKWT